jgi:hypothetical protein
MNTNTPHESRDVKAARLAYPLASRSIPRYWHPKSPHRFTQPQLVACVLLTVYLDLSYRDREAWLLATEKVYTMLELTWVPDPSTWSRSFQKLHLSDWTALKDEVLRQLEVEAEGVASDRTSLRLAQASAD